MAKSTILLACERLRIERIVCPVWTLTTLRMVSVAARRQLRSVLSQCARGGEEGLLPLVCGEECLGPVFTAANAGKSPDVVFRRLRLCRPRR
jgi:hypothetical protein